MRNTFSASAARFVALLVFGLASVFPFSTVFAAVSYSQTIALEPGWNVVSSPRILESHEFSAPETLANFAIYTLDPSRPSGWATMADLGQSEFTPLYGYFINNKTATSQTLTFNYKASTTPNERLFERTFATTGWYAFGIANPTYAKPQLGSVADTNSPDHILNSLLGVTANYDSVVDFTDKNFGSNPDSVALADPWQLRVRSADVGNTTEINALNDFRETKGYAIYIKEASTLNGFQNDNTPMCSDGTDNDGDGKVDHPADPGCASLLDDDESNLPTGTFALAKYSAYANQTVSVPNSALKIGEYRLTTGATDTFTLTGFGVDLSESAVPRDLLTDIHLVYGGVESESYATGSDQLFWVGDAGTVLPDSTLSIAVYATLPASLQEGGHITSHLVVSGISSNTGDSVVTDEVTGQTITVGNGTLSVAVDASTPVSALVVANSMPKVASFKYTAQNDSFTIKDMGLVVESTDAASAISEIIFKSGATEIRRVSMNGMTATGTSLNIVVPLNGSKVVDVYANLGNIGTGFASTSQNVGVTLASTKYTTSGGVEKYENTPRAGNAMYVFKTRPTITNVALPTTVLTDGTVTIGKFSITSDAGGTVAWRKLALNYTLNGVTLWGISIYDAANESTALANTTVATTSSAITFTSTADQEISGTKTYVVKGVIAGASTGDSVSTNIPTGQSSFTAPAAYASVPSATSFVWSDMSVVGHSESTTDWMGDFLVKNLPTDSQTLSK